MPPANNNLNSEQMVWYKPCVTITCFINDTQDLYLCKDLCNLVLKLIHMLIHRHNLRRGLL